MRVPWRPLARVSVAVVAALLASAARAEPTPAAHPGVAASVDACVPIDPAEFHRVLAIELGPDVRYLRDVPPGAEVTSVRITCVVNGIELRLEDPVTRKAMSRVLSIESLPDRSRTRLLALAAAEFVVASWIELHWQRAPIVEPADPAPSAGAREAVAAIVDERRAAKRPEPLPRHGGSASRAAPLRWALSASFLGQGWTSHDTLLIGAGLRILNRTLEHLAWTAVVDLTVARHDEPEGRVSVAHAGLGGALLLRGEWSPLGLYAGPGIRAGVVRIEGIPRAGTAGAGGGFFAAMPGPMAYGRAEIALSSRVLFVVDLEAGMVTRPARALGDGGPVFELDGAWCTGGAGLGASF